MIRWILEKVFKVKPNSRRSKREKVHLAEDILFFMNGISFRLMDLSAHGFALRDEGKFQFEVGKQYEGDLEIFEDDECKVRFKVARIGNGIIGCDVEASPYYENFFNDFKTRSLIYKTKKKMKYMGGD